MKIAVILFPGTNCENETARAVEAADHPWLNSVVLAGQLTRADHEVVRRKLGGSCKT